MKGLFLGVLAIIILGFGGLVYRNAVEHPVQPIACPLDAMVCPDGTSVARTGTACSFPACAPPNTTLPSIGIAFAVPEGFVLAALPDAESAVAYEVPPGDSSISPAGIVIRRYAVNASSTALETIRQTAIGGASGLPVSPTFFTSTIIGTRRFTVVSIERFEAVINTAYYLARDTDVLRFDAIDRGVVDWTEPGLDMSALPAHAALRKLLTTLQGQ